MLRTYPVILLCLSLQTALNASQDATTPGELRTDSTPNSISIEWGLIGDGDHDATCNVRYRKRGSDEWAEALPLFRVDYQWWYHTERAEKPLNLFAGSLMFLEPETSYQLRLDLADPDGGKVTKTGSEALDAGAIVPNIADDFVGNAPDLGANEFGNEIPHYGPREQ